MSAGILLAVIGPLEPALVRQLAAHHDVVAVQRRCSDLAELLAAANAGVGSIAVIDASSGLVDAELVRQLHLAQVRVVLIAHPDDVERTGALGADRVVAADTPPAVIAEEIAQLATSDEPPAPVHSLPTTATTTQQTTVIALSGPPGSTGRSTLAVALGAALAHAGPTLLIDADMVAPSIDVRLSILDDVSGLATCARRANQGRLDITVLRQAAHQVHGIAVLTGIGSASRWEEIMPATIPTIIHTASAHYRYVVIDTESVPWPEAAGYDQFGIHPGMVRQAVLNAADTVLHVARADTDGIRRLLAYLHDFDLGDRDHLVVSQVSAQVSGASPQATVLEVLARFSAVERATLIREDRRSCEAALLSGAPLTAVSPRSPASHDVWKLAAQLTGKRRLEGSPAPGGNLAARLGALSAMITARLRKPRRMARRYSTAKPRQHHDAVNERDDSATGPSVSTAVGSNDREANAPSSPAQPVAWEELFASRGRGAVDEEE